MRSAMPQQRNERKAKDNNAGAQSLQIESIDVLLSLLERDLFGKPASTFADHALIRCYEFTPWLQQPSNTHRAAWFSRAQR
jgi:hypothetical protein